MTDDLPVRFDPSVHRPVEEGYRQAQTADILKKGAAAVLEGIAQWLR